MGLGSPALRANIMMWPASMGNRSTATTDLLDRLSWAAPYRLDNNGGHDGGVDRRCRTAPVNRPPGPQGRGRGLGRHWPRRLAEPGCRPLRRARPRRLGDLADP